MSNRDDHWSSGADGVFDACGLIRLCNAGSCAENEQIVRWHNRVVDERDAAIARAAKAEADAIEWERKYQAAVLAFGELMASRERLAAYVRATDALSDVGKPSCVGPLSDWVGYHRHRAAARAAVDAAGDLGGAA